MKHTHASSTLLAMVVLCHALPSAGQEDPAPPTPDGPPEAAATAPVEPAASQPLQAAPAANETAATDEPTAARVPDTAPAIAATGPAQAEPGALEWHGGLELDAGYASYTFEVPTDPKESFHDFRGRFVLGPVFRHGFAGDYYLRGTGQVVAWVREELGKYQINVDDVYAQFGKERGWDLKFGRFETWPVYHKGLGFDYYTLEDGGALKSPPQNSGLYGVYKYELNFIYRRETPGRIALHLYPTPWLGFELAAAYGKDQLLNTGGVRGAADARFSFLRVSAGAEYREYMAAQEASTLDPAGNKIVCTKCADRIQYGFGGSAVLSLGPVEAGAGVARGVQKSFSQKDGTPDLPGSSQRTTGGGYLQADLGKLLLDRSLILGAGLHLTEALVDNGDFERHTQGAAYAAYPLGFNDAMLKLVVSNATLLVEEDTGDGVTFTTRTNNMLAARIRFIYGF